MNEEKEQLKESLTMLFTLLLMESHSLMAKLFGFAQISLFHYHSLSNEDMIEWRDGILKLREQYQSFRKLICKNMTEITNSSLLTTEIRQNISSLFTTFLYELDTFINYLLGISELALSENLDSKEQAELKKNLTNAKNQYTEGRKIIHKNLKNIESMLHDVI